MYFDLILGAACTQTLVELLFSAIFKLFSSFLTLFRNKLTKKDQNQLKLTKSVKKSKNQPKKDNFWVPPQGVDQLLHVDQI